MIDLRGDVRAGPRGNVADDEGVFNIMVGTAITLAIADGSKEPGALATVHYKDCWQDGLFKRRAKLDWLLGGAPNGEIANDVTIEREVLDDWRPAPFQNGDWLSLRESFSFSKSGMKSGRDPIFVAINPDDLPKQLEPVLANRADPSFNSSLVRKLAYRPLDCRYFYNELPLLNRPGPEMQRAWGNQNVGIYSMPFGVGSGPATWCHRLLPDYHSFSGRGGYVFPLYDRRSGANAHNLNPVLITALTEAHGAPQLAEDIFDAILCLLSAKSYTHRFAEDLEDVFPHIPFPADPAVFAQAVQIGRDIRGLEAFEREPAAAYRPKDFCRIVGAPDADTVIADISYSDNTLSLWKDDNVAVRVFTGLPEAVWSFSVSGYRVLPRWIDGRKGLPVTLALMRELRDVAARIAELMHWFDAADLVLDATLSNSLTREELGFPAVVPDETEDDA